MNTVTTINGVELCPPGGGPAPPLLYVRLAPEPPNVSFQPNKQAGNPCTHTETQTRSLVKLAAHNPWTLTHTQTRSLVELAAQMVGSDYVQFCDVTRRLAVAIDAYRHAYRTAFQNGTPETFDHQTAIDKAIAAATKTLTE